MGGTKIGSFYFSPALNKLAEGKDTEAMFEACDSTCTAGYDNDGSTGLEIFENGCDFGQIMASASEPVWCVQVYDPPELNVAWFFFGTEDEVRAKISALPDKEDKA